MIKVLLDTNIIVYRESDNVYKEKRLNHKICGI